MKSIEEYKKYLLDKGENLEHYNIVEHENGYSVSPKAFAQIEKEQMQQRIKDLEDYVLMSEGVI